MVHWTKTTIGGSAAVLAFLFGKKVSLSSVVILK